MADEKYDGLTRDDLSAARQAMEDAGARRDAKALLKAVSNAVQKCEGVLDEAAAGEEFSPETLRAAATTLRTAHGMLDDVILGIILSRAGL